MEIAALFRQDFIIGARGHRRGRDNFQYGRLASDGSWSFIDNARKDWSPA
jgi:hypothetical protein